VKGVEAGENCKKEKTYWPESEMEVYRPSDSCLLAKLVPSIEERRVMRSQCGGSPKVVIWIF
jgi:hypothetical protein